MALYEPPLAIDPEEGPRSDSLIRQDLTSALYERVGQSQLDALSEERRTSLDATIKKLVDFKMAGIQETKKKTQLHGSMELKTPKLNLPVEDDTESVEDEVITYDPNAKWNPESPEFVEDQVIDATEDGLDLPDEEPIPPAEAAQEAGELVGSTAIDVTAPIMPTEEELGIDKEKLQRQHDAVDPYLITRQEENRKTNPRGGYDNEAEVWRPHKSPEGGFETLAYGHKLDQDEVDSQMVHGIDISNGITDEQAIEIFNKDNADFLLRPDVQAMTNQQKTIALDYYHRSGDDLFKWQAWQNIIDEDWNKLWENSGDIGWDNEGQQQNYNSRNQRVFESLGLWNRIHHKAKEGNKKIMEQGNLTEG